MASLLINSARGDGTGSAIRDRLVSAARRLGGVALLTAAVFVSLACAGFDPNDPSFTHATDAPVANWMGVPGAVVSDLLFQAFGHAVWLLPIAFLSLGVRLLLDKRLTWPWLPAVALPAALLLVSAYLATWPAGTLGGAEEGWSLRTGMGGLVGDFLFMQLQPHLSAGAYGWITGIGGAVAALLSLGLRWRESLSTAQTIGHRSYRVGRQFGHAAGHAAQTASHLSGRAIGAGWRHMERRRPTDAPAFTEERSFKLPGEQEESWSLRETLGNFFGWFRSAPIEVENNFIDLDMRDPRPVARPGRPRKPAPRDDDTHASTMEEASPFDPPEDDAEPGPARSRPPSSGTPSRPAAQASSHQVSMDLFQLPALEMLTPPRQGARTTNLTRQQLEDTSRQLETVLDDFGVRGQIIDAKPGPVVTLFELEPAPGTRSQRVIGLADDIARSLSALSVRVATVPGRNVIGIELPNDQREIVFLRDLIKSDPFNASEARLPLALGKDISGNTIIVDLARMPHLLIAGTTGSGKSVAINAMILSLLYRLRPDQCRIIMIDPKVIELSVYEDIPHLLAPVVTEPHKAVVALKWVVRQMDERYRLMSHLGVRDIFAYNRRLEQARAKGQQLTRRVRTGFEPGSGAPIIEDQPLDMTHLPLIVVIVDEVADLMLTAGKEIESAIQRLSQKARAAGIHLIVATQRPSVDVLTGVIKANLPSRISFRVSSKIDSRTILGEPGAEQLLGQGDMLYLMPGDRIVRVHGALVSDHDVERVVAHLRTQGEPDYDEGVTEEGGGELPLDQPPGMDSGDGTDGVYNQAVQIVARDGKASTSYLQRKLSVGYNSAAKLIERMEAEGLITAADHVGRRRVLMGRGGVDGDEPTQDD